MSDDEEKHMNRWAIYIGSRELAKELGEPLLGYITADSKEDAERLAAKDGEIAARAYPGGGYWAVKVQNDADEPERAR